MRRRKKEQLLTRSKPQTQERSARRQLAQPFVRTDQSVATDALRDWPPPLVLLHRSMSFGQYTSSTTSLTSSDFTTLYCNSVLSDWLHRAMLVFFSSRSSTIPCWMFSQGNYHRFLLFISAWVEPHTLTITFLSNSQKFDEWLFFQKEHPVCKSW